MYSVRYLTTLTGDGVSVRTSAIFIRPASRGRCLVALPPDAALALGMTGEDSVSVATADGTGVISVVPVVFSAAALWDRVPPEWQGGHKDFPADRRAWPSMDALLDLERVDTQLESDASDPAPTPLQASAPRRPATRGSTKKKRRTARTP